MNGIKETKMKEERIFIEILKHDNGEFSFSVGGGTKDKGQMEVFNSTKECIDEIRYRLALALMDM